MSLRSPTRRLDRALRDATTAHQLLEALGQSALSEHLPTTAPIDELLRCADHEAALRRHPYIGPEHVILAANRAPHDAAEYGKLSATLVDGLPRRGVLGWRPRGPNSLARDGARRRLAAEQAEAVRRDSSSPEMSG
ncbi:MAG: hypothetical protein JF887_11630 [Candidatus Dormibacteraeota bacterium]|uniref:Clp R domain-containing protein n=1 Tax=Candidatus Amunia macphersoniae TaxID=3127014 RepID=A0A934KEY6_9BACT|nr:hypothetical protein [Candidatus Dormibacteraeota bacterium]